MGFISLVDEIQFGSQHICIRSIVYSYQLSVKQIPVLSSFTCKLFKVKLLNEIFFIFYIFLQSLSQTHSLSQSLTSELDSEDVYYLGSRNVGHQQQSF